MSSRASDDLWLLVRTSCMYGNDVLEHKVIQEYAEMSKLRKKVQTLLKVPAGHTVQMLFRLGHADPVPPAPRRRVADLLV